MRWLIAVHLVMAAAPLLQRVLLGSDFLTEWSYLVTLLPFGSAMTLSVWTGLGRASVGWRLLTGVIGTLYLGLWFTIGDVILAPGWPRMSSFLEMCRDALIPFCLVFVLFGVMFLILRRFYEIVPSELISTQEKATGVRFSVLHVLVLMSIVAVVLSLTRAVREERPAAETSALSWTVEDTHGSVIFLLNGACVTYAALWPSNLKRNVSLVLIVTVLLGVVIGFATRSDESVWRQFVASMFIGIIPTAVQLVSLLVVRSCGYRLVRRNTSNPT